MIVSIPYRVFSLFLRLFPLSSKAINVSIPYRVFSLFLPRNPVIYAHLNLYAFQSLTGFSVFFYFNIIVGGSKNAGFNPLQGFQSFFTAVLPT